MRSVLAMVLLATLAMAQASRCEVHCAGAVEHAACPVYFEWNRLLAAAAPKPAAALQFVVVLRVDDRDRCELTVHDLREDSKERRQQPPMQDGDVVFVPPEAAKGKPWTKLNVLDAALAPMLATAVDGEQRAWLQARLLARSPDRTVRQQMAQALAQGDSSRAVRYLVSVLDLDASIAGEAVVALGTMGVTAKAALPDLRRLADNDNLELRKRVATAIAQIEGKETGK